MTEDLISKHISTLTSLAAAVRADSIPEDFPSAAAYHADSVVSMIKLQSLPLIHILKNGKSVLQLESAILIFLETSSSYDWKLRLNYLESVVNAISANGSFFRGQEDATMHVKSFIESFEILFSSHLMDNLRKEFKDVKSTQFGKTNTTIFTRRKQKGLCIIIGQAASEHANVCKMKQLRAFSSSVTPVHVVRFGGSLNHLQPRRSKAS